MFLLAAQLTLLVKHCHVVAAAAVACVTHWLLSPPQLELELLVLAAARSAVFLLAGAAEVLRVLPKPGATPVAVKLTPSPEYVELLERVSSWQPLQGWKLLTNLLRVLSLGMRPINEQWFH